MCIQEKERGSGPARYGREGPPSRLRANGPAPARCERAGPACSAPGAQARPGLQWESRSPRPATGEQIGPGPLRARSQDRFWCAGQAKLTAGQPARPTAGEQVGPGLLLARAGPPPRSSRGSRTSPLRDSGPFPPFSSRKPSRPAHYGRVAPVQPAVGLSARPGPARFERAPSCGLAGPSCPSAPATSDYARFSLLHASGPGLAL
ncbi:skin secretory protein xP2-like [Ananas comosus]|uniref:Skin secretory protein xP2-like n=1 Tax=Ananas comosus TaxID=4615 RepID=A0A6P5EY57_ANACO|nr:skin secretory protein xP2-like [Ananas comosus]